MFVARPALLEEHKIHFEIVQFGSGVIASFPPFLLKQKCHFKHLFHLRKCDSLKLEWADPIKTQVLACCE